MYSGYGRSRVSIGERANVGFDVPPEFHHPGNLRSRRNPDGGNPLGRNELCGGLLGLS